MKVGFVQLDVQRNWEENQSRIDAALQNIQAEIVVLPELCASGYLFESREELRSAAQPVPDGKVVQDLAALSEKYACGLIAGVPELDGELVYNTAVLLEKGRYVGKYRKIHLSDLEKKLFAPGTENVVFPFCGTTVGVQICFDLWFPEISREQLRMGAEILCAPANFGSEPTYLISQVRAMENLRPLILCNRVGSESLPDIDADFLGKSSVIGADGQRILSGIPEKEVVSCCEISLPPPSGNVICRNFREEIEKHRTIS